jgi:hypothetical protein
VTALFLAYPLWWVLGLGVLIFPLMAVPMTFLLLRRDRRTGRRRPVALPPGFGLWLLFLAIVLISTAALGAHPAGTVPGTVGGRLIGVGYRCISYVSLTVLLVYLGNVTRARLPQQKLIGLLAWLFVVTVAGGLLGMFAGRFAFSSAVELLLPHHLRSMGFVQSLVHPSAAQIMDLLGGDRPRPAAPWGYTNTWGNNVCLLVAWFVAWALARRGGRRVFAAICLAVAVLPVIDSLNRGLWIGLGVIVGHVTLQLARRGRFAALCGVGVVATLPWSSRRTRRSGRRCTSSRIPRTATGPRTTSSGCPTTRRCWRRSPNWPASPTSTRRAADPHPLIPWGAGPPSGPFPSGRAGRHQ